MSEHCGCLYGVLGCVHVSVLTALVGRDPRTVHKMDVCSCCSVAMEHIGGRLLTNSAGVCEGRLARGRGMYSEVGNCTYGGHCLSPCFSKGLACKVHPK